MQEKLREFPYTRKDFEYLRSIANQRTGIVVKDDKFDMFYARLSRRVRSLGLRSFAEYCDYVRSEDSGDEVLELVNAITTNLTAFFRENHHFEHLKKVLIPALMQRNKDSRKIRIWSAGCSTGEEPYSLAITLKEALPTTGGWDASILATDIDSNVLAKAASGVYSMDRIQGIPKSQLRQWFMKGTGSQEGLVRLKPEVRSMIEFAQLNLMDAWSIDGPMDVIFCRNVTIYFDRESKVKLMNRYADNLIDEGHLFIGHSESLFKICDQFELIGNTIYRKKS